MLVYPETIDINNNPSIVVEDNKATSKTALANRSANESIGNADVSCTAKRTVVALDGLVWEWMPLQESKFKPVSRFGTEYIANVNLSKQIE